jgi:glutamine---fructose-6-phosphate transaminase (isomerizing)
MDPHLEPTPSDPGAPRPPKEPGACMEREMREQPAVLAGLRTRRGEVVDAVAAARPEGLTGVLLLARGSSDHAAVYARYALELAGGRPAALGAPSLYTRYGARTVLDGYLSIGVSQSGRTPEITDALAATGRCGARTLAVTNAPGSPLSAVADATITLGAGREEAVPATKTFTAQLAAFALVAEALGPVGWDDGGWQRAIDAVATVLDDLEPVRALAARMGQPRRVVQIGRGFLFAVALEAGLKISETTGLGTVGFSPADLRHGPIAATGPGIWALCFATPGPTAGDVADTATRLHRRGVRVAAIAESADLVASADVHVPVPPGLPEGLAPIVHVVRAQQLAREIALLAGVDPDAPHGLTKVTSTT